MITSHGRIVHLAQSLKGWSTSSRKDKLRAASTVYVLITSHSSAQTGHSVWEALYRRWMWRDLPITERTGYAMGYAAPQRTYVIPYVTGVYIQHSHIAGRKGGQRETVQRMC